MVNNRTIEYNVIVFVPWFDEDCFALCVCQCVWSKPILGYVVYNSNSVLRSHLGTMQCWGSNLGLLNTKCEVIQLSFSLAYLMINIGLSWMSSSPWNRSSYFLLYLISSNSNLGFILFKTLNSKMTGYMIAEYLVNWNWDWTLDLPDSFYKC